MSIGVDRSRCPVCQTPIRLAIAQYNGRILDCPDCNASLRVDGETLVENARSETRSNLRWGPIVAIAIAAFAMVGSVALWQTLPPAVAIREPAEALTVRDVAENPAADPPVARPDKWKSVKPEIVNRDAGPSEDDFDGFDSKFGMPARRPAGVQTSISVTATPVDEQGDGDLAIDRIDDEPILVPLAEWDHERVPILPIVDGGIQLRSEQRLETEIAGFRTSKPVFVHDVIGTLMDAASVAWTVEGELPRETITLDAEDSTIRALLDEVLSSIRFTATVRSNGQVAVAPVQ